MKIAVTAASGHLGSAIVEELSSKIGKNNVVGIVRTPENASHLDIEIRKGDYNIKADFLSALKGIDSVLLISGMDKPDRRIQQHKNVIEAAFENNVRKIVYTSIIGDEKKTSFSPIVLSNRQTEKDIIESGLQWVIGRNGIYIEPDLDYLDTYKQEGEIRNCAKDGKCGYTSRNELAIAYAHMLINNIHNNHIYQLCGESITQSQLTEFINQVFNTNLTYHPISIKAYEKERKAELGDFLGSVIAGIYHSIFNGVYDIPSDFEKVVGRPHQSPVHMMKLYKENKVL